MLQITLLYIAYIIFGGSLSSIQRVARAGRAKPIGNIINNLFVIIGFFVGIAILGLYWYKAFWFSPIALLAASIFCGSLIFGYLDRILGESSVHLISLIACPVSAIACLYIIYRL